MKNFLRVGSLVKIFLAEFLVMFLLGHSIAKFWVALGDWGHHKENLKYIGTHLVALALGLLPLAWFVYRVAWPKEIIEQDNPTLRGGGFIMTHPFIKPMQYGFTTSEPIYAWVDLLVLPVALLFYTATLGPQGKQDLDVYWWARIMMGMSLFFPTFRLFCWYGLKRQANRQKDAWKSVLWMMAFFIPAYLAVAIPLIIYR